MNFKDINKSFKPLLFSLLIIAFSIVGCTSEEKNEEVPVLTEGKIHYNITYPYYMDEFMKVMLPDVMTMEFKNNVYKNSVTKGGLFTSTLISDCNKQEMVLMLDFGSKQLFTKLDKALTDTMLSIYPIPDLLVVNNFDSIAGMHCDKRMAVYQALNDGYDCEVYTTKGIKIENSNWCNQFNQLEDVMLAYEVTQFGLTMRFMTDSVTKESISDDTFQVPAGFKEVTLEQMLFQMEEIFKQIIE